MKNARSLGINKDASNAVAEVHEINKQFNNILYYHCIQKTTQCDVSDSISKDKL